ncbi:MAG: hypothetical protein O2968_05950 [Acidobacteria bacterium]|nr:hypothetical protein [Acidobacteriota bacterium]
MWSISPVDRPANDLDIRRTTKSQDATLDSRGGQDGGLRGRRRRRKPSEEDAIEVDTFEHGGKNEEQEE